jgi:hypothetical protein
MFRVKPDGVCCCRSTLAISGRTKQTRLAFFLSSKLLLVLPVFGSEPIPDLNRTRTEPQYEFGGHRKTGPDRGSCSAREPLRESAIMALPARGSSLRPSRLRVGGFTQRLSVALDRDHARHSPLAQVLPFPQASPAGGSSLPLSPSCPSLLPIFPQPITTPL